MSEGFIDYIKRKNTELFKTLEKNVNISNLQNYIPLYDKLFSLNETNYNSINLNNTWYLNSIKNCDDKPNIYNSTIKHKTSGKTKLNSVFIKFAPIIDPFKYLLGKYKDDEESLLKLPKYPQNENHSHEKMKLYNNSAYTDGFFYYLTSLLINKYSFVHGVKYFGSYLGIKENYTFDILDDLEYIHKSDFFKENRNKKFSVDDYEYLICDNSEPDEKKPPIKISSNNISNKSISSLQSDIFEDLFIKNEKELEENIKDSVTNQILNLEDLTESNFNSLMNKDTNNITTLNSSSSCSSRTSLTSENENNSEKSINKKRDSVNNSCNSSECSSYESCSTSESSEEIQIMATIPKFPIQLICIENCEDTFDNYIMENELSDDEWFSALFQVIMILLLYQNTFCFTHNDLHTNNIMYNTTKNQYIYYCYNNVFYRVPTYGRIYKIIDYGRAIYKYNGIIFCSDSFKPGEDAATQYNSEPYLNENKPRLDPNPSFDLCRLACSIYDYLIEDNVNSKTIKELSPVAQLIYDWCQDDNKINILYKANGDERYPEFKLYKMIARCVHAHTPINQLKRPEFKQYQVNRDSINENIIKNHLINLDIIPNMSK